MTYYYPILGCFLQYTILHRIVGFAYQQAPKELGLGLGTKGYLSNREAHET